MEDYNYLESQVSNLFNSDTSDTVGLPIRTILTNDILVRHGS